MAAISGFSRSIMVSKLEHSMIVGKLNSVVYLNVGTYSPEGVEEMKRVATSGLLAFLVASLLAAQETARASDDTRRAEQAIKLLYDQETDLILRSDVAGMAHFYPDDFVVTNPFNQFIDKAKVLERVRTNIIKYKTYTRQFDYFRKYGDTVVVVGSELVVPTADANRTDAGQTVHRRFTEVWVRRNGQWQKVVRHANNIGPQ
jgi:ketosteroid isomerase-like protein